MYNIVSYLHAFNSFVIVHKHHAMNFTTFILLSIICICKFHNITS